MTFGACAKHPNFPMINCPMCESEKPLTMYNKEALRKLLEEIREAGAVLYEGKWECHNKSAKIAHDYITTRLAVLDDGDEINPETGKPYFEGLNKKGQWNKQFVDDGQEGKGLDSERN